MPETVPEKSALRRALLANRQAIAVEVRRQWDDAIGDRVVQWCAGNPGQTLGVYWPIRGEPDLRTIYTDLAVRGVRLALPVVVAKDAPLKFVAWKPGDPMIEDTFGVAVPAATHEVQPEALLVPCVGFNEQCVRLGYGGGFYDRTLAVSRSVAVGIGYSCCLADFDAAPHDIALDAIITETSVLETAER
jgi:5-formyltetrahydrofolate cyclo-ligase